MTTQYLQGDILLTRIESIPQEAVAENAEGEKAVLSCQGCIVTTSQESVESVLATVYILNEKRFLRALPGAQLNREEQLPLPIAPGNYEISYLHF